MGMGMKMEMEVRDWRGRAVAKKFPLAARSATDGRRRTIRVGDTVIGRGLTIIAGPCSVEDERTMTEVAAAVRDAGADFLRGGAFKPRSSPYDFQGYGIEALERIRRVGDDAALPVVTEVLDPALVETVAEYADVIQIGARSMHNIPLLRAAGRIERPILLKRAMHATLVEWLLAAEYIMREGNRRVILCERGIRTFATYTRNTLDIGAVAALRTLTNLPVIVDPSHGTGRMELVAPMCRAAVAAGANGVMLETHPDPPNALSDGFQSLPAAELPTLVADLRALYQFVHDRDRSRSIEEEGNS